MEICFLLINGLNYVLINRRFTPFRIEDAQLAAHSSLITARKAGVLNEKMCKNKNKTKKPKPATRKRPRSNDKSRSKSPKRRRISGGKTKRQNKTH